jgi:catechol 2,3-dioxygenase-like lactoylglutathione lyase family enzyme
MTISAHHVGLTVTDIDRSQAWYREALGFELQLEFELPGGIRGAMLRRRRRALPRAGRRIRKKLL